MSVQLVVAAGRNVKSPSASMVTDPPSLVAKVPAVTVSGPGPSTSPSPARMSPLTVVFGVVGLVDDHGRVADRRCVTGERLVVGDGRVVDARDRHGHRRGGATVERVGE